MSAASDLIERAERESGQRINEPNSNAIAILLGALSRELGQHRFPERDDMAVGLLIQDEIANGEERRRWRESLVGLLQVGLSPDEIKGLSNMLNENGKK